MKKIILIVALITIYAFLFADLEVNIPFDNPVIGPAYHNDPYTFSSEHFFVTNNGDSGTYTITVESEDLPDGWNLMWCHEINGEGGCHLNSSIDLEFPSGSELDLDFVLTNVCSLSECNMTFTFTSNLLDDPVVIALRFYPENYVSLNEDLIQPQVVNLKNYPNPFNPTTTISFNLYEKQVVETTLKIINQKGQIVRSFAGFNSGENTIVWNGKDNNGKDVSSGVYYYKLTGRNNAICKKMILMK